MNPVLHLRQSRGLSRLEFARRTGVSYQTLHGIENGHNASLPDSFLRNLYKFGVDAAVFQRQYLAWRSYESAAA